MATSGAKGLEIVEKNEVSLVISDHRMPEMTGVDFLSRVKDISPDSIRMMLTGYADLEASIAAINKGEVYRFITKPWNDEELLLTVKQALEYRNLRLTNRYLAKTVQKESRLLKELEEIHPGISEVSRSSDGAIIIGEEEVENLSMADCL
jgi:two-component system, probable response regulator PhcQ